ncbi:MAG: hypothetical protein JOY63_01585, partial [Acetobacteraceae bacterium]|nr:hypothetical protein [Acetobacteraceae bacterium]
MEHHVGIDVSLELSSLCVLDAAGRVVREAKVASEPEVLVGFLRGLGLAIARVGLEAGPLSQWLHDGLREAGHDVVLLETRHVKAALSAMAVKTDRRDAHGELWRSVRLRQAKFLNNIIETVPMCVVTNGCSSRSSAFAGRTELVHLSEFPGPAHPSALPTWLQLAPKLVPCVGAAASNGMSEANRMSAVRRRWRASASVAPSASRATAASAIAL